MNATKRYASVGALALLALGGCGGLLQKHTEFKAGPAKSVSISATSASLSLDANGHKTAAFTAAALDDKGLAVPSARFTWTSSNPNVATVDPDTGVVAAVGAGVAGISGVEKTTGMIVHAQVTVSPQELPLTFAVDIKPKASLSCSCHEAGGAKNGATGAMSDYANITGKGYVTAGDLNSPYLVKGTGGAGHGGGDAWSTNADTIKKWIQQGAKP